MALSHSEIVEAKEALYEQILDLFEKRLVYLMGQGEDCIFVYGKREALGQIPLYVNGIKVTAIETEHPPIAAI
jgi:hypothetical protein